MCGLAGWVGGDRPGVLERMLETLKDRGPDAGGAWEDQGFHLGHRRLTIIDAAGGTQPMVTERSVLVFNGMIYNHRDLRKSLGDSTPWKGRSDTEVLQRALETWGLEALPKLRGFFSLAWLDRADGSLLLARDPLGKKPLFYSRLGTELAFASTCRALRRHPGVSGEIDRHALAWILAGEAAPPPLTAYRDIRAVEPGCWIRWKDGWLEEGRHWNWPETEPSSKLTDDSLASLFTQAVSRRLESDAPLGVYLSGGLDSTSVAFEATRVLGRPPLTLSIGFEDPTYDEGTHALAASRLLGTEHHHEVITSNRLMGLIPEALTSLDQPLADGSVVPTFLLNKIAKRHVTVALTGDGGDDLMAGYDPLQALGPASFLRPVLRGPLLASARFLADLLPLRHGNLSLPFKIQRFLRGLPFRGGEAVAHWMSALSVESLHSAGLIPPLRLWNRLHTNDKQDALEWFRRRYLHDQILTKADRTSMAHGVELRSPLLDLDLVEALARLPFAELHDGRRGKLPLRRWATQRLPASILNRPKKGFGMPIAAWMAGALKPWILDTVSEPALRNLGLEPAPLLRLRDQHLSGSRDWRKELWCLSVACSWQSRR
ncbi:MAG: asparagine synthase (glutamine-hydrolyzing) [Planctomycetota bacterium]